MRDYDIVYLLNIPSFYKINLLNEVAKKAKIFVIFMTDRALERDGSFIQFDCDFDYTILTKSPLERLNNLKVTLLMHKMLRGINFTAMVVGEWNKIPYLMALMIAKSRGVDKRAIVVESSIYESKLSPIKKAIKKFILSFSTEVLVSGVPHRRLLEALGYSGAIITTYGVGIPTLSEPTLDDRQAPNYLYIGRFSEEKNLINLIEAFNTVNKPLTLIGSGTQEEALKARAKDNIKFLGYIKNEELKKILRNYDVLTLVSSKEPWGLVVDEALSSGLCALVSENIGSKDDLVLVHNSGAISKSCEVKDLITAIEDVEINYKKYKNNARGIDFSKRYKLMVEAYALGINTSTTKIKNQKYTGAKISIIIPVIDDLNALKESLKSILDQSYKNVEIIINDSSTTENIKSYVEGLNNENIIYLRTKKEGISKAFNAGLKASSGEYINFQGAGDVLENSETLSEIFSNLVGEYDLVFGRIKRASEVDSRRIIYFSPYKRHFDFRSMLYKMSIPHQALFTHRRYFARYGVFKSEKIFSMDYELLLRSYKDRQSLQILSLPIFVARWREGGCGTSRILEIFKEYRENFIQSGATSTFRANIMYLWWIMKYKIRSFLRF